MVFDPFSITRRESSSRHLDTRTPPMAGAMWALILDSRPWMARIGRPRASLSLMYSAASAAIVRLARSGAGAGVACSVSMASSAASKILRASGSEFARRSTRFHASPSETGALKYTW